MSKCWEKKKNHLYGGAYTEERKGGLGKGLTDSTVPGSSHHGSHSRRSLCGP